MSDIEEQGLYRADDGAVLRFQHKPRKNNFLSEQKGVPIFDTGLYVEVITPGSSESQPEFLVELTFSEEAGLNPDNSRKTKTYDPHWTRFKTQIADFKSKSGATLVSGMPLSEWAQIDAGTVATLRAQNIVTVEQLAALQDNHLQNLGTGGRTLREQAKQFLQSRTFGLPSAQAANRITELEQENAGLRLRISELEGQLAQLRTVPASPMPLDAPTAAAGSLGGFVAPPPPASGFEALAGLGAQPEVPAGFDALAGLDDEPTGTVI
jgi:hypothetical protein